MRPTRFAPYTNLHAMNDTNPSATLPAAPSGAPTVVQAAVQADSYLTLHYRLSLLVDDVVSNDIVNTFSERPATLQLGSGQLAAPLEERLLGLCAGDHAVIDFAAGQAFGLRNPDLIQKLSRATFDAESENGAEYQAGDLVEFRAPRGGAYTGVLKELTGEYALFDFNHPLAGQPVRLEVRIIGVL